MEGDGPVFFQKAGEFEIVLEKAACDGVLLVALKIPLFLQAGKLGPIFEAAFAGLLLEALKLPLFLQTGKLEPIYQEVHQLMKKEGNLEPVEENDPLDFQKVGRLEVLVHLKDSVFLMDGN